MKNWCNELCAAQTTVKSCEGVDLFQFRALLTWFTFTFPEAALMSRLYTAAQQQMAESQRPADEHRAAFINEKEPNNFFFMRP